MQSPDDKANGEDKGAEDEAALSPEALHAKAGALAEEGRLPEAEQLFREVVRRVKKSLGADHPGHGAALYELARVLSAQSKHGEAEGLLRRALVLFAESPGVAQPPYGQTLHTLASVLGTQDKHKDAEEVLRYGLSEQEKALGPDHAMIGTTLTNLAIILVQEQRLDEAEPLVLRSLAIAETAHGEAHAETARILTVLAQVQAALGKEEASTTARRALNSLVATHGEEHPLVQDVKPILEDISSPSGEADAILEEAAHALEARDAKRAVDLLVPVVQRAREDNLLPLEASASGMLAQALFLTGQRGEALLLAGRALTIAQEAGQEDAVRHFRELVEAMEQSNPDTGIPEALHQRIQSAIEAAQHGDIEGAISSLDAIATETQASGDGGTEATVRIVLGQILNATGQADQATAHLERALAIAEQVGDTGAADHVRSMLNLPRG